MLCIIIFTFLIATYLFIALIIRQLLLKRLLSVTKNEPKNTNPNFGKDFLFGASTAAYQIENITAESNWSLFEKAKKAPEHKKACEGIEKFDEDLKMMKEINLRMYRMGLSWSSLNPEKGKYDLEYMKKYLEIINKVKSSGIEPMVTIWHFEIPAWVEQEGGVLGPNFQKYLCDFGNFVVEQLKDEVKWFITINEPDIFSMLAYKIGIFPPGEHSFMKCFNSGYSLMKCHSELYKIIHEKIPDAKVSFAKAVTPNSVMHKWSSIEAILADIFNNFNTTFFDCFLTGYYSYRILGIPVLSKPIKDIKNALDFIALNHYTIQWVSINPSDWEANAKFISQNHKNYEVSDYGWGLCEQSLGATAKWVHERWNKSNLPIIFTENGCADAKDAKRPKFLKKSLCHLKDAIDSGVPVKGYCHWSLLDNYEWSLGYKMRFGLIEVNFETQERKIRESARIYSKIISNSE